VGTGIHHHTITTTFVGNNFKFLLSFKITPEVWRLGAVVGAPDPHGQVPTSTSHMYKVFQIIHMLWIDTGIYHHAISTSDVPSDSGFQPNTYFTPGVQMKSWCSG
jgi:hypothetical protein